MKNHKLLKSLILILCSVVFIQCTSDPIAGPAGADGINGADGTNGINGVDGATGTATCVACHSESHRDPVNSSYLVSNHSIDKLAFGPGTLSDYINHDVKETESNEYYNPDCNRCHSSQGFIDNLNGTFVAGVAYDKVDGVSCNTCHDKHGTFDFETDGHDFALRTLSPVTLAFDETIVLDYGTSNTCINCHQPKDGAPINDGTDTYEITSPYFGPHYGAQSTMLEGIQGAEIAGSMSYENAGTAKHRTNASCTSCHMGSANDNDGEHTMKPTLNSCTTCHSGATSFDVNGTKTTLTGLLSELQELLVTKGILTPNAYGGVDVVQGTHPFKLVQAYWNWKFIKSDGSHGIHNPVYTKALLTNSIESLK
ncbi:MAG: hypothetical protein COB98_08115 [Flavobacteriaceae bacterium]|nr:MAG: hypothetical protein COB98_08115 [Flavobacteriaceae bacterium]